MWNSAEKMLQAAVFVPAILDIRQASTLLLKTH
jgi:hypothetical protein